MKNSSFISKFTGKQLSREQMKSIKGGDGPTGGPGDFCITGWYYDHTECWRDENSVLQCEDIYACDSPVIL
jgi:hypothetical protein